MYNRCSILGLKPPSQRSRKTAVNSEVSLGKKNLLEKIKFGCKPIESFKGRRDVLAFRRFCVTTVFFVFTNTAPSSPTPALPSRPTAEPRHSVHFAQMFPIHSSASPGLRGHSHDLSRPENTAAKCLDLRKLQQSQPCSSMSHTSFWPTPIFAAFTVLLNSSICLEAETNPPLCFTIKETEAPRSEVTHQVWHSSEVAKLNSSRGLLTPSLSSVPTSQCFQKGSQDSFISPGLPA